MSDQDTSQSLAGQIDEAIRDKRALHIRGAASKPWMAAIADRPESLDLRDHRGVVSYDPTELVITVRAGTCLAELDEILAERGQMLGAECPNFDGASTVGGALATGWSGARRGFAGALRDFVLGIRIINGHGEILNFGGQVMKNVAGFDIARLMCGSQGRLGVILEVSLRVMPRPELEICLRCPVADADAARALVRDLRRRGLPLSAAIYEQESLALRFSGRASVLKALPDLPEQQPLDANYWRDLRSFKLPFFNSDHGPIWRLPPNFDAPTGDLAGPQLLDCGSGLSWYRSEQVPSDRPQACTLNDGPSLRQFSAIAQRVRTAFDPSGVFAPAKP